jgi:hypothetical protein
VKFARERFAVAVGEVRSHATRLRVDDPYYVGAVSEIEFHLQIELSAVLDSEATSMARAGAPSRYPSGSVRAIWELRMKLPSGFRKVSPRSLNPAEI